MLVSYNWLNTYFKGKLPSPSELADAITMHSFEIEGVEEVRGDFVLDVKVLPNRAHDCLSHRGMAREIGAILGLKPDIPEIEEPFGEGASSIDLVIGTELSPRTMFALVSGVRVGPSPAWLKERLEALGQRSISNVVDVTNYVMLDTGQPMHAFDAGKLARKDGRFRIGLKAVVDETPITVLGGKEHRLPPGTLVFTDENREGYNILDVAGTKGGVLAEVDEGTTDVVITAANFDQSYIRKFSKRIGIQTDATKRSENGIAPELAGRGIALTAKLLTEVAGANDAKAEWPVDVWPRKRRPYKVGVSVAEANRVLGTALSEGDISAILDRHGWNWELVSPVSRVLEEAPKLAGKPYRLGASVSFDAPDAFDCSSFTAYLFAQGGVSIPRISVDQFAFGAPVAKGDLRAGDLVFANTGEEVDMKIHYETVEWLKGTPVSEGVDHVGIYLGNEKVIHASRHNGTGSVDIEDLTESKQFRNFVGARRVASDEKRFVVEVPAERLDLRIKEDLIEEIGRAYGYEKVPERTPAKAARAAANKNFHYSNAIRNVLVGLGYDEVQTYAFVAKGETELENPLASDKAFLRSNLADGLRGSLEANARLADLLGLDDVRIFEIGTVFGTVGEETRLAIGAKNVKKEKAKEDDKAAAALAEVYKALGFIGANHMPKDGVIEMPLAPVLSTLPDPASYGGELAVAESGAKYAKISPYPFVLRDIALWVPAGTEPDDVLSVIDSSAGELLARRRLFDVFTKAFDGGETKTSYAFRLVFQSHEKTLSDEEANGFMDAIAAAITSKGWQVR